MLSNKDLERYNQKAIRILRAMDNSTVPIGWDATSEPELVRVVARELIRMDKEESEK